MVVVPVLVGKQQQMHRRKNLWPFLMYRLRWLLAMYILVTSFFAYLEALLEDWSSWSSRAILGERASERAGAHRTQAHGLLVVLLLLLLLLWSVARTCLALPR